MTPCLFGNTDETLQEIFVSSCVLIVRLSHYFYTDDYEVDAETLFCPCFGLSENCPKI